MAGVDGIDPHIAPVAEKGAPIELKRQRVAYFPYNGRCPPSQDVKATIESTASALKPHVASLKAVFPSFLDEAYQIHQQLFACDGFDWAKRILEKAGTTSSSLGVIRDAPPAKSTSEFVRLIEQWDALKSRSLEFWQSFDVLMCPISAAAAHMQAEAGPKFGFSYASAINTIGCPAVALRAGTSTEGLPIGVQVVAPMWRDDLALTVAELIEQELGGWQPIDSLS
jgi:amidase